MGEHRKVRRKKQRLTRRERDNRKARAAHSNQKISLLSSPGTGQLPVQTEDTCPKLRTEEKALSQKRRAEGTGSQLGTETCEQCQRQFYVREEKICKVWGKGCFKCYDCCLDDEKDSYKKWHISHFDVEPKTIEIELPLSDENKATKGKKSRNRPRHHTRPAPGGS